LNSSIEFELKGKGDLSRFNNLTKINLADNKIDSIDLAKEHKDLREINLNSNQRLDSIKNLSLNKNLKKIFLKGDSFSEIDLVEHQELTDLDLRDNKDKFLIILNEKYKTKPIDNFL